MPKPLVLYVISDIDRAVAFEWIARSSLDWVDLRLAFVFVAPSIPKTAIAIRELGIDVFYVCNSSKWTWFESVVRLIAIYRTAKPSVIHCHLLVANILGFTANALYRRARMVYTRHHSNLHHRYHPKGIVWDRYVNSLAHKVVSVSPIVTNILRHREHVPISKIVEIPHGLDLSSFENISVQRVYQFRSRHSLPSDKRLIGVIARFVVSKGIEYVADAFARVIRQIPDLHLVLMNAKGPASVNIDSALNRLPLGSFSKIEFEEDVPAAYASFSCFVHVPIDEVSEAFGQVYVEALAAGVPSVFTLSGIALSFVEHERNALVVPFMDIGAIEIALIRLLTDDPLRKRLSQMGSLDVSKRFHLSQMMLQLENLYSEQVDADADVNGGDMLTL
jgi:glycosyltransferase involved in cell wall biosynthesis